MLSMQIAGVIGQDGTQRQTPNGKAVLNFSVGVNDGYGENRKTLWVDCSLFGDRASKLAQYLVKGEKVAVRGKPGIRTYDKGGQTVAVLTMMVDDVTLLGGAKRDAPQSTPKASSGGWDDTDLDTDRVPF